MTTMTFRVSDSDTAIALGSGDVPVLATPRLLAWLEAATVKAVAEHLAVGQTSVGVEVAMRHLSATAVGGRVLVAASKPTVAGRRAVFDVIAYELSVEATSPPVSGSDWHTDAPAPAPAAGTTIVATGRVTRALVDRAAFVARLGSA